MDKNGILTLLYDRCLSTDALPELIADLESREDRIEVLNEVLRIVETSAAARGARDALDHQPPFVWAVSAHGDAHRFAKTLFPFDSGRGALAPGREYKVDFWRWQKGQASSINRGLNPVIPVARALWLERCEADPKAVGALAGHYADFVRLAAEKGQAERWRDYQAGRQYDARRGVPDCGHCFAIAECDLCWQQDFSADEAHVGWLEESEWQRAWGPRAGRWFPQRQNELCACCGAQHDRRPQGETACDLCAEAKFWCEAEHRARRWGGWFWLTEHLRYLGKEQARTAHADIGRLEYEANLVWHLQPWQEEVLDEIETFGTLPWSFDSFWEMGEEMPVGTVYLPVRIRRTDLKADVERRAKRLLDEVWRRVGLKTPRNAAVTEQRQREWNRYLDWLWQIRVDGKPLEQLENADSPREAGLVVTTRTIERGSKAALRALRGY